MSNTNINDTRPFLESIMAPALTAIKLLMVLAIIGALSSGMLFIIAIVNAIDGTRVPAQDVITIIIVIFIFFLSILLLIILRCFVLCLNSIEMAVRRMEYDIRKEYRAVRRLKKIITKKCRNINCDKFIVDGNTETTE